MMGGACLRFSPSAMTCHRRDACRQARFTHQLEDLVGVPSGSPHHTAKPVVSGGIGRGFDRQLEAIGA